MTIRSLIWKAMLIALFSTSSLWGQSSTGNLLGRVTDTTGAVLPNARISVLNTETNVHYDSVSNSSGDYLVPYLTPGTYQLKVDAPGFKAYQRAGIAIRQASSITANVQMELGADTEVVNVSSTVPLVDTSTASTGTVVESRQILNLPTKDGNPIVLATLVPGVVFTPVSMSYVRPFDTNSPSQISVNGTREGSSEFLLDGAPNMQGIEVAYSPAESSLSSFKVQTTTTDVSWGYHTGAQVNYTTKSGTNTLHGLINYQFLSPQMIAPPYFPILTGKPHLDTNHLDSTLTGPVYFPKIFNGHNKTFFTVGFEWGHWFDPTPITVQTVPTAAERTGDFSQLLTVSSAYQIYDPMTTVPAGNGLYQRSPFPGNIIPPNRINQVAAKIAALIDAPNQPGLSNGANNYTNGANSNDHYYNYLGRIDHNISDNQRAFVRYYWTRLQRIWHEAHSGLVGDNFFRYDQGIALNHVVSLSPTLVIESRYGFLRFQYGDKPLQIGWDLASLGFSGTYISQLKAQAPGSYRLPGLSFANYLTGGQIGNVNNFDQWNMIHEPAVNVTKIVSSHTIRSGVSYRVYMRNGFSQGAAAGAFSFNSTYTGGPFNTSSAAPIGQDFASFLLGIPASGSASINTSFAAIQKFWAFYAMDDWKLRPNLTITAGLRYELPSALTERYNRSVAGFDPTAQISIAPQVQSKFQQTPVSGVPAINVQGGLTFPGVNGVPRELWQRSLRDLMPRVGFAYSVTPKTVVRASYGVFRETLGIPSMTANQIPVPETGFQATTAFVPTRDNGQTYIANLTNPFPNGLTEPVGAALGASTNLGQTIQAFNPHLTDPYVQTWQLGLQRELPFNSVIEVDYVGNRGTRMRTLRDLNPVPAADLSPSTSRDQATINYLSAQVPNPFYPLLPGTNLSGTTVARAQLLRPYPQFATSAPPESGNGSQQTRASALSSGVATTGVQEEVNGGYSWYHALQASIQKRYSSGLAAAYSFTWAKSMQAITYKNVSDNTPERVISDLDRPIRNTVMVNYELPFGRGRKWAASARGPVNAVIGGWQVNGVYTYQSGQPLEFGNAIMTCSPSQVALPSDKRTVNKWFNTSCFNTNSAQQLQWNLQTLPSRFSGIRGPVVNNVDFSAMKFFQLTEKMRLSFSGQGINVLNHPQFQPPNTSPTSTAFGRITTQYSWQRIVEVSARLEF
jgi:hypothetical protein